jgi:hypothetical protein
MARASALRLRAEVGFFGVEAALGAGIRGHLAPSLFVTAVNLARRYALVALIVVKLRKILNL